MKSVFMCVNYPKYNPAIGISKKIKSQIEAFRNIGYNVTYSAYENNAIAIYNNNDEIVVSYTYPTQICIGLTRRFFLMSSCKIFLKNYKFDLGFVRWDAVDISFVSVLKQMRKSCKNTLMDFHGYFPNMKPIRIKTHYAFWTTQLFGQKLKKYITYGIGETKCKQLFGINLLTIDTGINVDDYEAHKYNGDPEELNLISVANETPYHGYDRIIKGLWNYYKLNPSVKVHLHLVGKMSKQTTQLIEALNLSDVIHLYGYQSGETLNKIYNKCNMGVGPLAPHRIGGKEGTGIKTKEYFALGLPYLYAGEELLVPEGYMFVHKFKAEDKPIDINELLIFWKSYRNDENVRYSMREFARIHYSWVNIFNNVLSLIKKD